jgi:diamine N-acetyltransferase
MLRKLLSENDIALAADVIRRSFLTVASEMGLTPQSSPSHPAFLADEALLEQLSHGLSLYGLCESEDLVGVVGIAPLDESAFTMEKLAVPPEHRHKGYGGQLVAFACDAARASGAECVKIGIVDNNVVLKQWYLNQGFEVADIRNFDHLPFPVCLMERRLS